MPIEGFPEKTCPYCNEIFTPKFKRSNFCCKIHGDKYRRQILGMYKNHTSKSRSRSPEAFLKSLLNKKRRSQHLTSDMLIEIYNKQDGKCAISGREMTYIVGHGRVMTNISIDQIIPNAGYIEGNIQLVCYAVNIMKGTMHLDELKSWCKEIISYG